MMFLRLKKLPECKGMQVLQLVHWLQLIKFQLEVLLERVY